MAKEQGHLNRLSGDKIQLLDLLLRVKKSVDTAPTHNPRNLYEQIEFYDDDTNQRLYIHINGSWKYFTSDN